MSESLSVELIYSALESSPDAMLIIDYDGRILYANQQVRALFGYAAGEVTGQSVEMLMPERFRARHVGHRMGFADENRLRPMGAGLELYARRRDGSEFPVEISLSPIQEGGRKRVIAAIRDVTDRKRTQLELIAAREAADAANRAKGSFLATASHDLRQPLQSLTLLNGTLRRLIQAEAAQEALLHQEQSIATMSRLLNCLLDMTRLDSGAIRAELQDIPVAALFEEMNHEFAGLAAAKGLRLYLQAHPVTVHTDPALTGQILRNLLTNAIKYTPEGSVVLRCLPGPAVVEIEVADTGVGIPADQLPHIYGEFYQVGVSPHTSRDGYGLGLSIVERLVTLLGIRLDVRSEVGVGTVFTLGLPYGLTTQPQPVKHPARAARPGNDAAPVVLLVEDDPAVMNAMRMLLTVEGYRVKTATSVAEARRQALSLPSIDLLVTDYHLNDGETGTEVIDCLRGHPGPLPRAVLISGDTSPAVRDLQQAATVRLISKPVNADELLTTLQELLRS